MAQPKTKPKPSLVNIDDELEELALLIMSMDGEISEEDSARYDALLDLQANKYEALMKLRRFFDGLAESAKEDKRRIAARQSRYEKSVERIRDSIEASMIRGEKQKVETAVGTAYFSANSRFYATLREGIEIEEIPERFIDTAPRIMTDAIKAAGESGDSEALALLVVEKKPDTLTIRS